MTSQYFAGALLHLFRVLLVLLVISPLLLAAPKPAWWSQRGATDSASADDFAAANLGQLKHIASKARDELNAQLPGGAGAGVEALVASFGINLTQLPGVVATQSSEASGGVASRAIDNNTDGDYMHSSVSHTDGPTTTTGAENPSWQNPWWQVDLGALRTIRSVAVWNRTDSGCGPRLTNFYVLISDAPMGGISLNTLLGTASVWKSAKITVPPPPTLNVQVGNARGRYVMIRIDGPQYLHLAEVKVNGVANSTIEPPDDFAMATLGQLKSIAKPFYDRLIGVGYTNNYPWTGSLTAPDNSAATNLGQLKYVFNFNPNPNVNNDRMLDFFNDSDNDGIPDWWETRFGLNPNISADASNIPSGEAITNLQKFQASKAALNLRVAGYVTP